MRNIFIGGVVLMAAALVGCQQETQKSTQAPSTVRPSALDVSSPAISSNPTYRPASPAVTAPIEPAYSQTPAQQTSAGGNNYIVKKGDTLFGIARNKYGDGKQWQRIASANPGVSPSSLRVGQTLVVPQ